MDPMTMQMIGQKVAGVGQSVSGLIGGIVGLGQRRQARRLLRNLHRPTYNIPNEVLQNQKMAQLAANQGLPSAQYAQAMQNISRQQNQALQNTMDRRGGLMTIAQNQQSANDAMLNLDVANANARLQNQRTLYGVNSDLAGYRDKAFEVNQMQPYQQKFQYANSLLGAGNQNIMGGIDKIIGGTLGAFGGGGGGSSSGGGGGTNGLFGNTRMPNYSPGYGPDSEYSDFTTATGY